MSSLRKAILRLCFTETRQFSKSSQFHAAVKQPVDPDHAEEIPIYQYAPSKPNIHKRIYTWGFAGHGAQGERNFVRPKNKSLQTKFTVKRPHRLEFGEHHDVVDVACGYGFSVFAVKSKTQDKVFGCGLNPDSQIGYQAARKNAPLQIILEPVPISIPFINPVTTRVQSVACGRAHTVISTDEGVFTLGHNGYGQCGRRIIANEVYRGSKVIYKVPELEGVKMKKVVCGQDHRWPSPCVRLERRRTDGVGHYDNQESVTPVVGDVSGEKIVNVATSADCVLAINDAGNVFGWGNNEYGQLNFATDEMQLHTSRVLKLPSYVGRVVDIAVGGTVSVVVNDKGSVFTWGFGTLGKGPALEQSSVPEEIPPILFGKNDLDENRKVVKVFAGITSFYAVNDNGDVYAWGRNRDSILGLNHNKNQFFPLKVSLPCKLVQMSCGVDHVVAICRSFV